MADEKPSTIGSVSEAISSLSGLAKPVVETGARLIESLLGKPCQVAGELVSEQLYAWQWANRCRIAAKAQAIMEKNGTAAKVLPKGFLLPLIEATGNVEDDDLQDLWAQLLASGAQDAEAQHPAFIETLRRMNAEDARSLRELHRGYIPGNILQAHCLAEIPRPVIDRLLAFSLLERVPSGEVMGPKIGHRPQVVFRNGLYTISAFGLRFLWAVDPAPRKWTTDE